MILVATPLELFKTVFWENTKGALTLLVVMTNGSYQCQNKHANCNTLFAVKVRLASVMRFRRWNGVIYRACSRFIKTSSGSKDVTFWSRPFQFAMRGGTSYNLLGTVTADSHITCRAHAAPLPFPCHAETLIHTCHAAPLPWSNSAVSFVKVCMVAGNIRKASPVV